MNKSTIRHVGQFYVYSCVFPIRNFASTDEDRALSRFILGSPTPDDSLENKNMKVILFAAVVLLNLASVVVILTLRRSDDVIAVLALNLMLGAVIQSIFSYHIWNAIHDGKSGVHPFVAAGLHYIPVLGFFWTLISFGMYPSAYNSYAERRYEQNKNFGAVNLNASAFNHYVIFSLISIPVVFIPVIKFIVPIISLGLYLRVINEACGGVEVIRFNEQYANSAGTNEPMPKVGNPLSLNV